MLKLPTPRRFAAVLALAAAMLALTTVAAFAFSGPVKVRDNYFAPKSLTVNKGTKLTWQWAGTKYHNVSVKSGPVTFQSHTQFKGSYSHTFTRAGTYHLYCTIHKTMTMTVVVK